MKPRSASELERYIAHPPRPPQARAGLVMPHAAFQFPKEKGYCIPAWGGLLSLRAFFIMDTVRLNIQMFAHVTGDLVRAQRLQQGLSQAELARNAHVSRSVLSRLESGKASVVQTDVLDRLFHALGCTPTLSGDTPDVRHRARLEQRCRLEQNRSRHLRLAIDLLTDARAAEPLIAKAKARVALWREKRSCSPYYIDRWSEALDLPPHHLAKAIGSFGEWEDAMFQNSPWSWAWN